VAATVGDHVDARPAGAHLRREWVPQRQRERGADPWNLPDRPGFDSVDATRLDRATVSGLADLTR
jgi:hypothetical protein